MHFDTIENELREFVKYMEERDSRDSGGTARAHHKARQDVISSAKGEITQRSE